MKDVAYYLSGGVRRKTLLALKNGKQTPVMISKDLDKHRSSVSRVLIDLEKKGYAVCENPESDKYRFYSITNKGLKLIGKGEKYFRQKEGSIKG